LPPSARIHYEYQNVYHKLRVASFSGPPLCCFLSKMSETGN
jgi:hypothetical protein